jgi:hypothetical protein
MLGSGAATKDGVLVALGSSLLLAARRHPRAAVPSDDDPSPRWLWVLFANLSSLARAIHGAPGWRNICAPARVG